MSRETYRDRVMFSADLAADTEPDNPGLFVKALSLYYWTLLGCVYRNLRRQRSKMWALTVDSVQYTEKESYRNDPTFHQAFHRNHMNMPPEGERDKGSRIPGEGAQS